MLNEQQFKSKWTEIKGGLRNLWGRLTDEELELTKGSLTSIAQLVEKQYGETKNEIRMKLKTLMNSFDNPTDRGLSPDESSFERSPDGITTSEVSQNQDIRQGLATRDEGTRKLEERSFKARKENIGGASYNGSSNNSPTDDSEETLEEKSVAKASAYKTSINKEGSNDRIARH
jgi:uncharacterized protein YjbJ (UPF0337 family)